MIVHTNLARWLSAGRDGIAIWPFAFILPELKDDESIHNHERIHLAQQRELWVIPFLIMYFLFWVEGLLKREAVPYRAIPFEREAYDHESDPDYLATREPFAWARYRV